MDNVEILHHRYARALFDIVRANKKEDRAMKNLELLNKLIEENKTMARFLYHPGIGDEEKVRLLMGIAKMAEFCDEFVDFTRLLVKKRRLKLIHGILLGYRDFYNKHKKRVIVFIKSAHKLEDSQLKRLKAILAKRLKGEVVLRHSVDPLLIGGLLIKAEDRIYDTSLKTGLVKLKEAIT